MTTVAVTTADHTSIASTALAEQYLFQFRSQLVVQVALVPRFVRNLSKVASSGKHAIFGGLDASTTAHDQGADFSYTQPTDASVTITPELLQGGVQIDGMTQQGTPGDLALAFKDEIVALGTDVINAAGLGVLIQGGTHVYGGDATKTAEVAAGDDITGALIKNQVTLLRNARVPPFGNGFYRGIMHSMVAHDYFGEASGDFATAVVGNDSPGWRLRRLGVVYGVEWFESSSSALIEVDGGASDADVYHTPIFGPGCLGMNYIEVEPPGPDAELEIDLTGDSTVMGPGMGSRAMVVRMVRSTGKNASYYRHLTYIGQLGFGVPRSTALRVIETTASLGS